jgi:hypothetical protein
MKTTTDKRQGLRAEEDQPGFAYLNSAHGLAIACKVFEKTEEEIEAIVGRYARGSRVGELRGSITWSKLRHGGWISGFGVADRGLEFGHAIQNWDGDVLFGFDRNRGSRVNEIAKSMDRNNPGRVEARAVALAEEQASDIARTIAQMQRSLGNADERAFIVAKIESEGLDVSTFEKYLELERELSRRFQMGESL